jgi:hypothetical protein
MNDPFEILHDELVRVATSPQPRIAPRLHRAPRPRRRYRSRLWLRRPLILAIVLVGASASAGALALAGTFDGGTISPQAWVAGQRVQPEATIPPDQASDLAILRRPRVAADALSEAQASELTNSPEAAYGPNPSLSRSAQGLSAGAAWLIPGNGSICFEAQLPVAGGGTCQSDATVDAGHMMIVGGNGATPGVYGVGGVVPDGVSAVTITPAHGTSESVAVHENVYIAEVRGDFSVSFNGPDGPVTVGTSTGP